MSKVFIADKETLDAVKTAADAITATAAAIKSVVDAQAASWTNARAVSLDNIANIHQNAMTTVNNTTVNNTANSTGTLSQKLSHIISQISGQGQGISASGRRKSTKIASATYAASTTTTLLDTTGPGELIFVYIGGQTSTGLTLNLTIDGVSYTLAAAGGRSYGIGTGYVDGNLLSHITDTQRYVVPISFAKICKVTITNSGTTTAACKVLYNKYESAN